MSVQTKKTKLKKILAFAPLILLYASTLNEFDFNYLTFKYFSFNDLISNSFSKSPLNEII